MFCQYCGAQIEDGSRFCTSCGRLQEDDAPQVIGEQGQSYEEATELHGLPLEVPASRKRSNVSVIPVMLVAALALLALLFVGAWRLGWFGPTLQGRLNELTGTAVAAEQGNAQQPDSADVAQEVTPESSGDARKTKDESTGGDASDSTSSSGNQNKSASNEEGESAPADTSESDGVGVRSNLSEYSWDELSQIAREIEAVQSLADALAIAKRYNLITATGAYVGTTKDVRLSDGKTMHMRLVGVWHDRADTDSGKAGLSLLSDGVVARHRMHSQVTIYGGWEYSEMRTWLQRDLMSTLPGEVSSAILPVYKKTNNKGETRTTSCVSDTKDTLWLPSIVELCGPVDWEYEIDPSNADLYNSIFNAEGTQYGAFAQETIDNFNPNTVFALGGEWWMRSVAPAKGKGRYVDGAGDPSWYADANEDRGVVVGFCL